MKETRVISRNLARRMAIFAAMVDRMDQEIGRVISFDWRQYEEDHAAIAWLSVDLPNIRGRCFVTLDSVFIPTEKQFCRIDRGTGKCADFFRHPLAKLFF